MGKWELWTDEIKDAPPIPKVSCFKLKFVFSVYVLNRETEYYKINKENVMPL